MTKIYIEIILGKLLDLLDFIIAQTLHINKITKIVIIVEDQNSMLAIFKTVLPCFKNFKDSQKFIVLVLVASFNRNHFMEKIGW